MPKQTGGHQAYDWQTIISEVGVRHHQHYALLDSGDFAALLDRFTLNDKDPYAQLDSYMLYGAAAILGRNQSEASNALSYQNRLNEKTRAVTLFFWAQEAAAHLQHATAVGLIKPLVELFPKDPELNSLMAICCQQQQDLGTGWSYIRTGLKYTPEHIGLNSSLSQYYMAEGQLTEAEATARYLLTLDQNNVTAFNLLSRTAPQKISDDLVMHFRYLAEQEKISPVNRAGLMFDLGRIYDRKADYEQAFRAVDAANKLMKNVPQTAKYGFDEQAEFTNFEKRRNLLEHIPQFEENADITPVFIIGLPRTGSTLLDQTLATHPEVVSLGETPAVPQMVQEAISLLENGHNEEVVGNLASWRTQYLAKATGANPKARFLVDKTLGNSRHMGLLKKLFPNAKFLHVRRDFMDTGLSIYFAPLLRTNIYATDLAAIAGFIALDEKIIKSWAHRGHGALDVHYEDMVGNMEQTLMRTFTYIGLSWHADCLNFHQKKRAVHTYSAHQVRKAVYKSSKGRWQNYARQLAPFQEALRDKGIAA